MIKTREKLLINRVWQALFRACLRADRCLLTLPCDGQTGADDSPVADCGVGFYMSYCVSSHR